MPLSCVSVAALNGSDPAPADWDACVAAAGSDLYFSYDWCRLWWEHYGAGRELHVLAFRRGPVLVGVLPLVLQRTWLGPVPVRIAKLVGADSTIAVLKPAVQAVDAAEVYPEVLRRVFGEWGCDLLYWGPLSGERAHADELVHCSAGLPDLAQVLRAGPCGVHAVISLPDTLDAYLAGLSKSERGNYRRDWQRLCREHEAHYVLLPPSAAERGFEDFVALHTAQWRHVGRLGHFGDWPGATEFNRALMRALAPQGRARLGRLFTRTETLQMELSFTFGETSHWRLPARSSDVQWDRYGLGRVACVERVRCAIADGVRHIEAGPGHYEYKLRLGYSEFSMHSVLLAAPRALAQGKARVLATAAGLLDRLYYRAWFNRIAPHLPLRRHPLWKSWIRTRFL